ncbi:MAG: hypothetical protein WB691_05340 [Pseudolabrys sp.]
MNVSCARVGIQDDNAIAVAKRISWLILDIAINVFSKLLLKMIEEVFFASGGLLVKPDAFWKNISDALFVGEKWSAFHVDLRHAEWAAIIDLNTNGIIIQSASLSRL